MAGLSSAQNCATACGLAGLLWAVPELLVTQTAVSGMPVVMPMLCGFWGGVFQTPSLFLGSRLGF